MKLCMRSYRVAQSKTVDEYLAYHPGLQCPDAPWKALCFLTRHPRMFKTRTERSSRHESGVTQAGATRSLMHCVLADVSYQQAVKVNIHTELDTDRHAINSAGQR